MMNDVGVFDDNFVDLWWVDGKFLFDIFISNDLMDGDYFFWVGFGMGDNCFGEYLDMFFFIFENFCVNVYEVFNFEFWGGFFEGVFFD